jgi:dTMP kinase
MPQTSGKLIVLDGADGSGKATQTALLLKRLKKEGHLVKTLDFPQYEKNLFGALIGECLAGHHGDFAALDPYIASTLYACDRFESKARLEKWLAGGYVVVLDRYVSANQIHQGGKMTDPKKRKAFLEWLDRMEFGAFGLPRPDLVLYLDVPYEISARLLAENGSSGKKTYLRKHEQDTVENNEKYLRDSRESALRLIQKKNRFLRIACAARGEILPREVIADRIWEKVRGHL